MSDDLLRQYNRELSFIRQAAGRFAQEHPKIAERLRLGPDEAEDPHVERMIQAFAFLSARVRQKLDDEFPEITESLLGVLYPHYQAPIPSMGVVQMRLARDQTDLPDGFAVPAGTALETDPIDEEPIRFRTTSAATLWPIEVESATLGRPPMAVPPTAHSARAAAYLRLVLRCVGDETTFQKLNLQSLRFFLKGQPQHSYLLY
jgi:type VI secretion system protein ImpG